MSETEKLKVLVSDIFNLAKWGRYRNAGGPLKDQEDPNFKALAMLADFQRRAKDLGVKV